MMKRVAALLLSIILFLTGCVHTQQNNDNKSSSVVENQPNQLLPENEELKFDSLDDQFLLDYIEDLVYSDTVKSINSEKYLVEEVTAIYVSKEYLEEVAFNSQSNIYFGYTLSELEEIFQGQKYIFTLGENGETAVKELEEIKDVSTETMIRDVAIGTGVILICITISTLSAGSAPAISVIFAASATTAKTFAISSATFGGISAGIVRGIQTGDFKEAISAASLNAAKGFKWGALSGAIVGGGKEAFLLNKATKNGLNWNEAAIIQKESNLPIDVISQFHSKEEYQVYLEAGLKPIMVNGKTALVQNIDLNYVSELQGKKVTNLIRMQKGYAPIDPATGKAYELHHIGQKADATLAVLTKEQHRDNLLKLHDLTKQSEINRAEFAVIRKEFWKYLGNNVFTKGSI